MIKIIRSNSEHDLFIELVKDLDEELKIRDGEEHAFYDQYNKIDHINHMVVAIVNEKPVGCGAIKIYQDTTVEIKRMFVSLDARGSGIASNILTELEIWAKELRFTTCILETGVNQPEAIGLYKKNGYKRIPNYGPYKDAMNSLCFEKTIQ
jgi:putative acetyltransferase